MHCNPQSLMKTAASPFESFSVLQPMLQYFQSQNPCIICWAELSFFSMGNFQSKFSKPDDVSSQYPPHLSLRMLHVIHRHGHRTPVSPVKIVPSFPSGWPLCSSGENVRHALLVEQERQDHRESSQSLSSHPKLESKPAVRFFDLAFEHPHTQNDSPKALEVFFKRIGKNPLNGSFPLVAGTDLRGICYNGQLTDMGRECLSQFGVRMRELYGNKLGFLPMDYNEKDFYFRSTDYARTIESLQSLLIGLFPATATANTQNISICIRKEHNETMYDTGLCKWLKSTFKEYSQQFREKNNSLIKQLQEKFIKFSSTGKAEDVPLGKLKDFLVAYDSHGFEMPENVSKEALRELEQFEFRKDYGYFHYNTEVLPMAIGRFLAELVEPMKVAIGSASYQENMRKLYIYSGHDSTIVPLLSALGILGKEGPWPPFASNVIIELFSERTAEEKKDNFWVRVKFQEKPVVLPACKGFTIEGDESLCQAEQFLKIVDSFYPKDYAEKCI